MERLGITFLLLIVCMGFGLSCKEAERNALLEFKHSIKFDYTNFLGSWEGEECCSWKGVGCDNITGNVVKLDLRSEHTCTPDLRFLIICTSIPYLEAGEVNPALLELKYLTYLDLSGNVFYGSRIPEFFGSLKQLRYLNLSMAHFSGKVPHSLGNLTELVVLDLSRALFPVELETNIEWAFKLKNLQYLDLSGINLSQSLDSLDILCKLPTLSVLNMGYCGLGNSHLLITNSTLSSSTLQHLDLRFNRFSGPIPRFIQNLSALTFLDLSFNALINPSFSSGSGNIIDLKLDKLQFLDMSGAYMGQALDSLYMFHNLPSLLTLILVDCHLEKSHLFIRNSNSSTNTLQHLDLRFNNFNGQIPHFIQNLSSIEFLDLSFNRLNSSLPSWLDTKVDLTYLSLGHNDLNGPFPCFLENSSFLTSLDLSNNHFGSSIPSWLANKTYLEYLDLSSNHFNYVDGGILNTISRLCRLNHLDISNNQLHEVVLESHVNFPRCSVYDLEVLSLNSNNISGHLPIIGSLSALQYLNLSDNNLEIVPPSLGGLSSLVLLDLSYNQLSVVHQASFVSLSSLEYLDISSNSLFLDISYKWMPPFQLWYLNMIPCKLNSPFPNWLLNQEKIYELDLSDTGIFGPLPYNIGNAMPSLRKLQLASNDINGSIPRSLCEMASLEVLDLKHNRLSGTIPNCWVNLRILGIELSSNRLSGPIPNSFEKLANLQVLSLSNNTLEGELALSFINFAKMKVLDVGKNKLVGEIPSWNAKIFPSLQILILRENRFQGTIPPQLCSVHKLQVIDLASNNLSGIIPECFGHFEGMGSKQRAHGFISPTSSNVAPAPPQQRVEPDKWSAVEIIKGAEREYTTVLHLLVNMDLSCNNLVGVIPAKITSLSLLVSLNLSYNHLMGTIPREMGDMKSLESLDLSCNNLSGSIPESISLINSLSTLNLSFNNLQGQIPTGSQLQTLRDPSIYMGNPGLCGEPLPKCFNNSIAHSPTSTTIDDEEEENDHEKMWFYLVIILGFATGFWGVIATLAVKRRWRHAYFRFAEELAEYIRVAPMTARPRRK